MQIADSIRIQLTSNDSFFEIHRKNACFRKLEPKIICMPMGIGFFGGLIVDFARGSQKDFPSEPKVVKFDFSVSKLRKKLLKV